jgi:outer membrane murein-binding lipoprotein Lpp
MRSITTALLASITALGLLAGCGSDDKVEVPDSVAAASSTVPDLAAGVSVPNATIDLMISQLEAAGMKVDRECFTALLSDPAMLDLAAAGGQGTPSPELMQKFTSCMSTGG